MTGLFVNSFITKVRSNQLIIKNYSWVTIIQVFNILFNILLYPLLIKSLGVDGYGVHVLASVWALYASTTINLGFDISCIKYSSKLINQRKKLSLVFSGVFFAKLLVWFGIVLISLLLLLLPGNKDYGLIYFINISGTLGSVFLFSWFFHGLQKSIIISLAQFAGKMVLLPCVLVFVQDFSDLLTFTVLWNVINFAPSLLTFFYILKKFNLIIRYPRLGLEVKLVKSTFPFFFTTAVGQFKYKSLELIIGYFFGYKEVAVYDLANRIYSLPNIFLSGLNSSLFPKVLSSYRKKIVRTIILFEVFIAVIIIFFIFITGRYLIGCLGGEQVSEATFTLNLLSVNIFSVLIASSIVYFIIIPLGYGKIIFQGQMLAITSYVFIVVLALNFWWNMNSVVLALVISGLIEVAFCSWRVRNHI